VGCGEGESENDIRKTNVEMMVNELIFDSSGEDNK
jgi:hypothetical protein